MLRRRNAWLWLLVLVALALLGRYLAPGTGSGPGPSTGSAGECGDKFAFGRPTPPAGEDDLFVCHTGYALLYDPALKVSRYSAERLTRSDASGEVPRTDAFAPDPDLPPGTRAELVDYRGSGFDRGHLSPAADFSDDAREMEESFYLSNMVPQNGPMNEGIWAGLESATRACGREVGEVYVLTGPVYQGRWRTVGPDKVAVPTSLYKVVLDPHSGDSRAFVMPNRALQRTSDFTPYAVPIAQVEQLTGLTFFPQGQVVKDRPGTLCADAFGS